MSNPAKPAETFTPEQFALLEKANLANIVSKIKAGKVLNIGERQQLRAAMGAEGAACDTIDQAADRLNVTRSEIQFAKRKGAPGFRDSRIYPLELGPWLKTHGKEVRAKAEGKDKLAATAQEIKLRRELRLEKRAEEIFAGKWVDRQETWNRVYERETNLRQILRQKFEIELKSKIAKLTGLDMTAVGILLKTTLDESFTAAGVQTINEP